MKKFDQSPPRLFHRFFRWYCRPGLRNHIEGDLIELYKERLQKFGKKKADVMFIIDTLSLFRQAIIKTLVERNDLNSYAMYKSYFKIGWRRLLREKGYSFINISGLAMGMTVAIFIGLWIYDELSHNKYHKNYKDIAQVWSGSTSTETSKIEGGYSIQYPVKTVLQNKYRHYFRHVLMAWWIGDHTLANGHDNFNRTGEFIEPGVIDMLTLKMLKGNTSSLQKPNSIILSKSTSDAIFGDIDPMNRRLKIDGRFDALVTGIYEDIPKNNRFSEVQFFSPWDLWVSANSEFIKSKQNDWDNRPFNLYVQLQENTKMESVNAVLKDLYRKNVPPDFYKLIEKNNPFVQLIPMPTWHLYAEFENGKPAKGRIMLVWLFGIVGVFVLSLACINFINLSTARSEKRAREVGVRKAIGSGRLQLIMQFLSESFTIVLLSFVLSVALVIILKGWFNEISAKDISLPFANPTFWILSLLFLIFTGVMAGLYPAFFLSRFQPVKVLNGVLRSGRFASTPRKVLVVLQFTVSVILIIGTLVVYQQIRFAQNRPVGYDRQNLITVQLNDPGFDGKMEVLRALLLGTGVVSEISASSSPLTAVWNTTGGYDWPGKNPNLDAEFAVCRITHDFGKTIGWKFVDGRDFSRDFSTDSSDAIIVNEAAVKYMGLINPVGQKLTDLDKFNKPKWSKTIVGVVQDMVMESPYEPVQPTIFYFNNAQSSQVHLKINPAVSARVALPKIKDAITTVSPSAFFDYKFVDEEYGQKFIQEQRIGTLASLFSILAIAISCLGLFGLASFIAEQRTKEIGIRKVLGASILGLWKLLAKDFVVLVIISCFIAIPIGYYLMHQWLQKYEYHTPIPLWILLLSCVSATGITLLTVSYQSIKAATMNPVKSLRTE